MGVENAIWARNSTSTWPANTWPAVLVSDWDDCRKYAQYPYTAPSTKQSAEDIQKQIEALQNHALSLKRYEASRRLVSGLNSDQLTALLNDTKRLDMLKAYLEQLFQAHEIEDAL